MNLKEQLIECMLEIVKEKIEEVIDNHQEADFNNIRIERCGDWFKMGCNEWKLMEFDLSLLEEEQ